MRQRPMPMFYMSWVHIIIANLKLTSSMWLYRLFFFQLKACFHSVRISTTTNVNIYIFSIAVWQHYSKTFVSWLRKAQKNRHFFDQLEIKSWRVAFPLSILILINTGKQICLWYIGSPLYILKAIKVPEVQYR